MLFRERENIKQGSGAGPGSQDMTQQAACAALPAVLFLLAVSFAGLRTAWGWAAFCLAAVLLGAACVNKELRLPGVLWLWFFGWLGLCALLSPEPLNSLSNFSKYPVLAFFLSLTASLGGSVRARRAWLTAVFGAAAALAAALVFQRCTGREVHGLIGANPNYSAAALAAAFSAALVLTLSQGGRRKIVCGLLAAGFLCGIIAANSRGAMFATAAAAAAYLWTEKRWRALAWACAVLVFAAAAVPADSLAWFLKTDDPRAYARLWIWKSALEAALSRPFFGFGPGLFERAFEIFKFPWFNGVSYYGHFSPHAHSEILNLAAEAGFPAAALYVCAVWRSLREKASAGFNSAMKFGALALFMQGAVDIVFYSGAVSLLFFGCLGFCAPPSDGGGGRRVFKPALLAALALCLFGFSARIVFERDSALALNAASPAALARARAFAPLQKDLLFQEALLRLGAGGNTASAAALCDSAAAVLPADPLFPYLGAEAYVRGGNTAGAAERLKASLSLEPNFIAAREKLSRLLFSGVKAEYSVRQTGHVAGISSLTPDPRSVYDMLLLGPAKKSGP